MHVKCLSQQERWPIHYGRELVADGKPLTAYMYVTNKRPTALLYYVATILLGTILQTSIATTAAYIGSLIKSLIKRGYSDRYSIITSTQQKLQDGSRSSLDFLLHV